MGFQTLSSSNAGFNGNNNIALGYQTAFSTTSGNANISLGIYSLYANQTGSNNIALGSAGLYNLLSGNNNIGIGLNLGTNIINGSNNIFIGANSGNDITDDVSDTVCIGSTGTINTYLYGTVIFNQNLPQQYVNSTVKYVPNGTYASCINLPAGDLNYLTLTNGIIYEWNPIIGGNTLTIPDPSVSLVGFQINFLSQTDSDYILTTESGLSFGFSDDTGAFSATFTKHHALRMGFVCMPHYDSATTIDYYYWGLVLNYLFV
jgi:hypothetical protein